MRTSDSAPLVKDPSIASPTWVRSELSLSFVPVAVSSLSKRSQFFQGSSFHRQDLDVMSSGGCGRSILLIGHHHRRFESRCCLFHPAVRLLRKHRCPSLKHDLSRRRQRFSTREYAKFPVSRSVPSCNALVAPANAMKVTPTPKSPKHSRNGKVRRASLFR